MAEATYGMHPTNMNSDETRKKEADYQPLGPANEQEKPWRLVSSNTGLLVASRTKGLTERLRNLAWILHQVGSMFILTSCLHW